MSLNMSMAPMVLYLTICECDCGPYRWPSDLKIYSIRLCGAQLHKSCKSGEIYPISSLYDMCKHVYDTRCMHGEQENRMPLDPILTAHCKYGPDPSPFRQNWVRLNVSPNTLYVILGTGLYGSNEKPTVSKHWRKIGPKGRPILP